MIDEGMRLLARLIAGFHEELSAHEQQALAESELDYALALMMSDDVDDVELFQSKGKLAWNDTVILRVESNICGGFSK